MNSENKIRESINEFIRNRVNISEHALELVASINGVDFINDSIAINAVKTYESLRVINKPVILIVGGVDSRTDYNYLKEIIAEKVKCIISISSDNSQLLESLIENKGLFVSASSMDEAAQFSKIYAKQGDVVLFSPACPSYHAFDNYRNRGEAFKAVVHAMK